MPFNGSGTFVVTTSGIPVVTGTVISSTMFNSLMTELSTGLSLTLTKDGQSTPTANITLGGYKLTNVGVPTLTYDALSFGQVATISTLTLTNALTAGNGGTGLTSAGTVGNVLTSNGTTWASTAPAAFAYPGAGIANSTGTAWGTSYTTSGSGTVVALATTPTFTTNITTPLVIGGTAAASTLTLRSTSGVGTTDVLAFQTGSQVERMRITSAGNVGIGTASPTAALHVPGNSTTIATLLTNIAEPATISATAATGTIAYYPSSQSVLYYTSDASGNWTLNITFSAGTTLNTAMATGQAITVAFLVTNGATAYYNNVLQIDGSTVTPKYQGGTAYVAGNASSVDIYTYTIFKTGNAAFTVFASQTKFA